MFLYVGSHFVGLDKNFIFIECEKGHLYFCCDASIFQTILLESLVVLTTVLCSVCIAFHIRMKNERVAKNIKSSYNQREFTYQTKSVGAFSSSINAWGLELCCAANIQKSIVVEAIAREMRER